MCDWLVNEYMGSKKRFALYWTITKKQLNSIAIIYYEFLVKNSNGIRRLRATLRSVNRVNMAINIRVVNCKLKAIDEFINLFRRICRVVDEPIPIHF